MRLRLDRRRLLALGACLGLVGCGVGDLTPAPTIIIDGSSTVFRISKAAQEAFADVEPDVTVIVDNHGTGGGFSRYLEGEVDIIDASRDAKPDEKSKAWARGMEWTRLLIAYDGITVAVNPKNDFARELSVEQLKRLWEAGSTVKTWKDLDPSWPDREIVIYSPDDDSGTYEFFVEAILGKGKQPRDDVQQNSDDNILINGVAGDVDGIGYFGYAYYNANKDRIRPVGVKATADAPAVIPSPESIGGKTYVPLSRPLYLFVKNSAARRPEVARFLGFYLDEISTLATTAGYDPPTPEDVQAGQAALAGITAAAKAEALAPAAGEPATP
ncbi:PstS family phosphate ABC transporter substrate-binding protein [Paludisphaera sp.]|uniref:PstS family phosphate ABC transporter substrate-binding protein n=1 Tax=Paludisphaera sp. TaxID=2017432 RepID=UPI00301BB3FA